MVIGSHMPLKHVQRVNVVAFGLPGDVEPLLALAGELAKFGLDVSVSTHRSWEAAVRAAGHSYLELHGDMANLVANDVFRLCLDRIAGEPVPITAMVRALGAVLDQVSTDDGPSGTHTSSSRIARLVAVSQRFDERIIEDVDQACCDTDGVIVGAPLAPLVDHLALQRAVPIGLALTQPIDIHGSVHQAAASIWARDRAAVRAGIGSLAIDQLWTVVFRPALARWARRNDRALPARHGPSRRWVAARIPIAYGLSPTVVSRPNHWPTHLTMAGYWYPDRQPRRPSAEVMQVFQNGEPPVYVDFGSMVTSRPDGICTAISDAAGRAGRKAIVHRGWAGLEASGSSANVIVCPEPLPAELIEQTACVVHHGGVMATAAGLRAGVPNIVVPSVLDQHAWAARVEALGAGPPALPRSRMNADSLAEAIVATDAAAMRRAAMWVGQRLRAEDGTALAARHLVAGLQRQDHLRGHGVPAS